MPGSCGQLCSVPPSSFTSLLPVPCCPGLGLAGDSLIRHPVLPHSCSLTAELSPDPSQPRTLNNYGPGWAFAPRDASPTAGFFLSGGSCRDAAARGRSCFLLGSQNSPGWGRLVLASHRSFPEAKSLLPAKEGGCKDGQKGFWKGSCSTDIFICPGLHSSEAPSACPDLQLLLPQLAPCPVGTKTLCELLPSAGGSFPSSGSLRSVPAALEKAEAPQDAHQTHLHTDTFSETLLGLFSSSISCSEPPGATSAEGPGCPHPVQGDTDPQQRTAEPPSHSDFGLCY